MENTNSSSLISPEEADFADPDQRLLTIVLGQYVTTVETAYRVIGYRVKPD